LTDSQLDLDKTLNDVRIQHAVMNGMSILNLSNGEVIMTKEDVSVDIVNKLQTIM